MTSRTLRGGVWASRGLCGLNPSPPRRHVTNLQTFNWGVGDNVVCSVEPTRSTVQRRTLETIPGSRDVLIRLYQQSKSYRPLERRSGGHYASSTIGDVGSLGAVRCLVRGAGKGQHGGAEAVLPLRTWSRNFWSSARQLQRKAEQGRPQPTASQTPDTSTQPARSLRQVLPKSIGALTPHENIYTVPNLLTFSRLIAVPFIGYAILHDAHAWALGLLIYAGVSDLLDGWIARRWKLQTVVGSVVDPMADKMLMTVLTICLATKGSLPVWLAGIILGRDVGLAIAAIYYRWISLPPPKTFVRYWDFSLPSAEVRPTTISKYNTFLQLALMGATTVAPLVAGIEGVGTVLVGLQYIVATTTIWSGLSYVFSKDAVKILSDSKEKKEQSQDQDKPKEP